MGDVAVGSAGEVVPKIANVGKAVGESETVERPVSGGGGSGCDTRPLRYIVATTSMST
jgi:hypothetical protein